MFMNKSLLTTIALSVLIITISVIFLTREGELLHGEHTHSIDTSHADEVHVHGDFRLYIGDERIRFTDDKYQSSTAHAHHVSLHFHDGNDEVIHRHADGVTLAQFFDSIGLTLTDDCLTVDTGVNYCSNDTDTLMLIVNGERVTTVTEYMFAEEDRILVYYGDASNPKIKEYVDSVTDLACLYSGTCPERGTPPTEGCGLTCDVTDFEDEPAWWQTWK